jgi:tRNA threonylcarbamoyladenosine biosynthesis protein TsaB
VQPTILAVGTSGPWCSVALQHAGAIHLRDEKVGNGHSQRLLPMAADLLAQSGLACRDVELVAFDAGPGGFTGLRIGCGVAQGIALGAGCPVVPVGSLAALAWPHGGVPVFAAIDARMGQCYFARVISGPSSGPADAFDDPGARPALADPGSVALELDAFAARVTGARGGSAAAWVAVGDAFRRYPALAARAGELGARVIDDAHARADALVALAIIAWQRGAVLPADEAAPIYVRDKVALDVDEQAAQRLLAAGSR